MGLVRVGTMPTVPLSLSDVVAVLRHLRAKSVKPLDWLETVDDIEGVTPDGAASLRTISDILHGFGPASSPWEVLARILLDRTRIAAEISGSAAVATRAQGIAIWQFLNFVKAQPRGAGLPTMRLLDRIRRLVILSDERDLRQLPAAAQGIDAVRLMTIHGSKGLEFPVVHIPGLNADTLPRSPNMIRGCAPPDGMVEGAAGSGIDVLKTGHVEEQECLFFVALSRAQEQTHPLLADEEVRRPQAAPLVLHRSPRIFNRLPPYHAVFDAAIRGGRLTDRHRARRPADSYKPPARSLSALPEALLVYAPD